MLEKYKYTEAEQKELLKSIVILVDTREKENLHILDYFDKHKIPYKKKALSNADYSFYIPANEKLSIQRDLYYDKEIIIERKRNLEELSMNFCQSRTRFEEEFATSLAKKKYLLIENANYYDIIDNNYNTKYNNKSFLATLHSFNHKYDLQIGFMPKDEYSAIYIYTTFQYYLRNLIK